MTKRMSDEDFEDLKHSFKDLTVKGNPDLNDLDVWKEANRSRQSELDLKDQIGYLFEYLIEHFNKEMLNEDGFGACASAVEIMQKQRIKLELNDKIRELFKEETDILKLDRKKLIELVRRLKSICLQ